MGGEGNKEQQQRNLITDIEQSTPDETYLSSSSLPPNPTTMPPLPPEFLVEEREE